MDYLTDLSHWHWFVLGVILLAIEVLGAPGMLLGLAIAALSVSGLTYFEIITHWQYMLLYFAITGFVFSLIYWKLFKRYNDKTDAPDLNDFSAQMVGTRFILIKDYSVGKHRIQIDDTFWQCELEQDMAQDQQAEVISYEGNLLKISSC